MRSLIFKVDLGTLSGFDPEPNGQYKFIVRFENSGGGNLIHPRLSDSHVIETVPYSGTIFNLSIPNTLLDSDELIDIKASIYRKSLSDCCVENVTITIPDISSSQTGECSYSFVPTNFSTLINNNGVYSETHVGDYEQGGVTYRQVGGRTYRAFYWINDIPWGDVIGGKTYPKSFKNVPIKNGLVVSLKKVYHATTFQGNYSSTPGVQTFEDLRDRMWESSWGNDQADINAIYKTSVQTFVTCGGDDLNEGDIPLKKNPQWLRADTILPQYYNNPAENTPDKPFTIHYWPLEVGQTPSNTSLVQQNLRKMKEAAVTHLWYVPYVTMTGSDESVEGMRVSHMLGTQGFGSQFPGITHGQQLTQSQAIQLANSIDLSDYMVITTEYSEGSFPQFEQVRAWVDQRLNERINTEINPSTESPYVGIQILSDYGYGSKRIGFSRKGNPADTPMSSYYINMVGDESTIQSNIEQVAGSPWSMLKGYHDYEANFRGSVVSSYYSHEITLRDGIGQYITEIPFNAIVFYNYMTNGQPFGFVTWDAQQSNTSSIDIHQKNGGTTVFDGEFQFPQTTAELLKILHFFGLLLFDSVYQWGGLHLEYRPDAGWKEFSVATDAGNVGVRWYSDLVSKLNSGDGVVRVADYKVNGVDVTFSTSERRISNRTDKFAGNTYFNQCAEEKRGMMLVIDDGGSNPSFIWINPYKGPHETENVIAKYNGNEYNLGECPGMTLCVTDND